MSQSRSSRGGMSGKIGSNARKIGTSKEMTWLARFGYVAKGVVYLIIGLLAAKAAIGDGGATTDRKGALQAIFEQPFGKLLLAVVAIGLLCYALWSFVRAAVDPDNHGTKGKGVLIRIGYAVAALSYMFLAYGAIRLVMGTGGQGKSSDTNTQDWTAELLKQPFGVFLVSLVGLLVIAYGLYQLYVAYKDKFLKQFNMSRLSATMKEWLKRVGKIGIAARGIVFAIIGFFLVMAAINRNPGEAVGLGGALQKLLEQPYGPILLGVVALGFVMYGIYSFFQARYRSFRTS